MPNIYKCVIDKSRLVPFSKGTDEEIFEMIDYYYKGFYTLDDIKSVWNIGDTRMINLSYLSTPLSDVVNPSSQYIMVAIADFDHDSLENPITSVGITKALITLTQVDCLIDEEVYLGLKYGSENNNRRPKTITTTDDWATSYIREWGNKRYLYSLPINWKNKVRQVAKFTWDFRTKAVVRTSDYVFLPSIDECFINSTMGGRDEGSYSYPYFTQKDSFSVYRHLIKQPKFSEQSEGDKWWTRSVTTNDESIYIDSSTTTLETVGFNGMAPFGISPMFCL